MLYVKHLLANIQFWFALLAVSAIAVTPVLADESAISNAPLKATVSAKVLVYIHPQEYTSQIRLLQYYRDYWFVQGSLVEAASKDVLAKSLGDVGMCDNQPTYCECAVVAATPHVL